MPVITVVRVVAVVGALLGIGSSASALVTAGDASAAGTGISLTGVLNISTGLVPSASITSHRRGTPPSRSST